MEEKRKLERFKMHLPAVITFLEGSSENRRVEWPTRDISADGAFFLTNGSVPTGTRVNIELQMNRNLLVQNAGDDLKVNLDIQGVSIRNDETGTAVSFDKVYEMRALRDCQPGFTQD